MQCRHHPDREARVVCQKMVTGYCQECLENGAECADPTNYCKFRSQCIIHQLSKDRRMEGRDRPAAGAFTGA
ncbi:MAG: hypothetical protein K9M82_00825 [Deltaproteobacteria bacterium]|nr:hypothetical protein [Deltaproteobacteria bacterium]